MAVDDAGLRRDESGDARQFRLQRARRVAADHLQVLDAVGETLLVHGLDFLQLGIAGGDDQFSAFAVRHAVRGAKIVEQAPAARAVARAQRILRIIHPGVDDLAVARGDAGADGVGGFRDDDVVPGARRGARHRETDHSGANDQNLHRGILTWGLRRMPAPTKRTAAASRR